MTSDPQAEIGGGLPGDGEAALDMQSLLEKSDEYRSPQRGEVVEGVVMGWDRDGALIDIGSKTEGVIPKHEMRSLGADAEEKLQTGEKVLVFIVQPETAEGQILLSIDRARGERGWHILQERFDSSESFEGEVTGYNKGGLLVNVEGVNAFVPLSQVVGVRPDREGDDGGGSLADTVGRTLSLKVIEINRRRNRVILSERAALQEIRLQQKERLIEELNEGDIRRGRVSSVRSFGVFIDLGGADGLAHLSELSWERDKSPSELFKVGDEVDVYVTKIDPENKRIALSLRRANPEKWDAVVDKYQEGQVITGLVTKLVTFGAFARVEGPVEGLIHVSELVDRRIGHPREVAREGDLLPLKIVRIERDRHRLGLSLRRAREEGEAMGFVFSEGGEVLSVPEDIRAEFEERAGPLPEVAPREAEAPAEAPEAAAEEEAPAEAEAVAEGPAAEEEAPAEAPETVAEEPAAEEEAPTEAPEAVAEEPAAEEAAPSEAPEAVAEEPAAEEAAPSEAPEAAAEEPAAEEEAPSEAPEAVADEPAAEEEAPSEAPEAVADEPAAEEEAPAEAPEAVADEPAAEEEASSEAPEAVAEEPVAEEEAPTEAPEAAEEEETEPASS